MPHTITPLHAIPGRELNLVDGAKNYWNLTPASVFRKTFPDLSDDLDARVALLHKEQRGKQGFDPMMTGAGGSPIGDAGAVDGRNLSLQLPFAMYPQFVDVLTAFNALGLVQIPHSTKPGLNSSPGGGAPFYGTTPADYKNEAMTLPAMLEFFKNLGFVIHIDSGHPNGPGPVQKGLPQGVWEAICKL